MKSILILFAILGISHFFRNIDFILRYRIHGSLTGGCIALFIFSLFPDSQTSSIFQDWKDYPTICIALVFSSLFLEEREQKSKRENFREVVLQTIYVYIAILGQILLGIALTIVIFKPIFSLPIAFSSVLENGFAGGHGTAIAMKESYSSNNFARGSDFALFSATVGIIFGIVGGIFIVKHSAHRAQYHKSPPGINVKFEISDLFIQLGLISFSVFTGYIIKDFIKKEFNNLPEFPLFIYSLFASVLIRRFIRLFKNYKILNNSILSFFSGFFMEILIFTAIATMNITTISQAIIPLVILFSIGFLWNLFCHIKLRKKLLPPEISYELSIINFGMLNGTTAIGLMLLRMIDPELKSRAVKIYAESAPFSSPVLGGGVLTLALPYLLNKFNSLLVLILLSIITIIIYLFGIYYFKKYYGESYNS